MELGIALPTSAPYTSVEHIVHLAKTAEELGYRSLWTYERLLYPTEGTQMPNGSKSLLPSYYKSTYEPLETLAFVAAHTRRVRLGTSIVNAPFQSPVALARRFATLDQLSHGRAIAGLGQGWMTEEFMISQVSPEKRGQRMDEYVAALRAIWGPDPVQFEGAFYQIPSSLINPKPVQQPGIPVLLGATTVAAARRAGRIADIINPNSFSFAFLESIVTAFRTAAKEAGRDPSGLQVIIRANVPLTADPLPAEDRPFLGGSPTQIVQDLKKLQELEVDEVFFSDHASSSIEETVRRFEELQNVFQRLSLS